MIVLVSLIVLLRGLPCFHDFSHGASHPYPFIQLSDFCTCSTYFCIKRSYTHAYMHRVAHAAL